MKVIIDCDPGIDDIYALMISSLAENIEVLAITVVHGNTSLENCYVNTKLAIQKLFPTGKNPPVYYGAAEPMDVNKLTSFYYGNDGIADTSLDLYKAEVELLRAEFSASGLPFNKEAASILVELINAHPNEITVLALGPLTNLALAAKLSNDPDNFTKKIKKLVIMGGNEPVGFSPLPAIETVNYPEFNFALDPLAAKIVVEDFACAKLIVTFDACRRSFMVHKSVLEVEFAKYLPASKRVHFLERLALLHLVNIVWPRVGIDSLVSCDFVAAVCAFYADQCTVESKFVAKASVEVNEPNLRGLLKIVSYEDASNGEKNTEIVIQINKEQITNVFLQALAKLADSEKILN